MTIPECPNEGWTLAQAWEFFVDQELLTEITRLQAQLVQSCQVQRRVNWLAGSSMEEDNRAREQVKQDERRLEEAQQKAWAVLIGKFHTGALFACGRPGSLNSSPAEIAGDQWLALTNFDLGTSSVGQNIPNGSSFFAVRVWPGSRRKAISDPVKEHITCSSAGEESNSAGSRHSNSLSDEAAPNKVLSAGMNGMTLEEAFQFTLSDAEKEELKRLQHDIDNASPREKPLAEAEYKKFRTPINLRFYDLVDHRKLVVTGMIYPFSHDSKRRVIRPDLFRQLGWKLKINILSAVNVSFVRIGIFPFSEFQQRVGEDRNRFEGLEDIYDWFGDLENPRAVLVPHAAETSNELAGSSGPREASDPLGKATAKNIAVTFDGTKLTVGEREFWFKGAVQCKIIKKLVDNFNAGMRRQRLEEFIQAACQNSRHPDRAFGKNKDWKEVRKFVCFENGFIWLDPTKINNNSDA